MYLVVKHLHLTFVVVSLAGFVLRGIWMLIDSPWLGRRVTRILPHLVDTGLLASAIALAIMAAQYPLVHGWLTAKVVALLIYIGLGVVALRPGRSKGMRVMAWGAALVVFGYILTVAITKDPAGFLAWQGGRA